MKDYINNYFIPTNDLIKQLEFADAHARESLDLGEDLETVFDHAIAKIMQLEKNLEGLMNESI